MGDAGLIYVKRCGFILILKRAILVTHRWLVDSRQRGFGLRQFKCDKCNHIERLAVETKPRIGVKRFPDDTLQSCRKPGRIWRLRPSGHEAPGLCGWGF